MKAIKDSIVQNKIKFVLRLPLSMAPQANNSIFTAPKGLF